MVAVIASWVAWPPLFFGAYWLGNVLLMTGRRCSIEGCESGALWMAGIGLTMLACTERSRPLPQGFADAPMEEHTALGASFVSGDAAVLRRLLHADLIVQPPVPDSAQRGDAAIEYLLELAAQTAVAESRLEPHAVVPEGPFVFEQGIWLLRSGDRLLRSPYTVRWRATPEGWRVVLWRWGAFR